MFIDLLREWRWWFKERLFYGRLADWLWECRWWLRNYFDGRRLDKALDKSLDEARPLIEAGKYAEAAAAYARTADEMLRQFKNELLYASYCQRALEMWIKAKNPECALQEARKALRVLSDSGWLGKRSDEIEDMGSMASELYATGYTAEAETLTTEVNEQLAALGLPRRLAFASGGGKFPTSCPQCGGSLSSVGGYDKVICSYCGSIIRAE